MNLKEIEWKGERKSLKNEIKEPKEKVWILEASAMEAKIETCPISLYTWYFP